jgi:hypothetical protein
MALKTAPSHVIVRHCFAQFGIVRGGLHDGEIDERGGTALAHGEWDDLKTDFEKFHMHG